MISKLLRLAPTAAACALLLPASADAKKDKGDGPGNGHGHGRPAWAGGPKAQPQPAAPQTTARRTAAEEPVVAEPAPEAPAPEAPAPVVEPAPVADPVEAPRRKGHGRTKPKSFVFHGRVVSVDAAAGTVAVLVRKGNSRGRRFRGEVVTFDARAARIDAIEADGAAGATAGDVLAGDRVVVEALLPQSARPDGSVVVARRLVDLTEREPVPVDAEPAPDAPAPDAPAPEDPVVE